MNWARFKMFPRRILSYLITLTFFVALSLSDDGAVQILVEHSIGGNEFVRRGVVKIIKSPNGDQEAEYVPGEWTKNDQQMLLQASKYGLDYKVRAPTRFSVDSVVGDAYVMSSLPACALVGSHLADTIHVAIDSSRQRILSISDFPLSDSGGDCDSSSEMDVVLEEFNTTVHLVDAVDGPIPETQAYLQKLEREKQERQRGEQGDNRSFLAKYWMYIVPIVIVLMLSSAMNPDAQGGGGGNR